MPIKTFKSFMDTGEQQTLRLSTNKGLIGYRILKFQAIDKDPGTNTLEGIFKVYTTERETIDGSVKFDDPTLIAICYFENNTSGTYSSWDTIIVDNKTVNQDLYITYADNSGGEIGCNYYIELEQVKLSVDEAAVATLKDMRGSN